MSSPLILRIVSKFDNSGVKSAKQDFESLSRSMKTSSGQAGDSQRAFEEMTAALAGTKIEFRDVEKTAGTSLKSIGREAKDLINIFRLVRRFAIIGTVIGTPFIAATKRAIELQDSLRPLSTTLTQLGQNATAQEATILSFAKSLELTSGTKLAESLGGLQAYIKATKNSSDSVKALSTAETLHFATGKKVSDILTALGEAQKGNVDSLANLTDKRKEDVFLLVQQGNLLSELSREFSGPAAEGANSLSNKFSTLINNVKRFGVEAARVFTGVTFLGNLFNPGAGIFGAIESGITKAKTLKKELDEAFSVTRVFRITNFEDSLRTVGKLKAELQNIQTIIQTQPNISREQLDVLIQNRNATQEQVDILEKQIARERELPSIQRAVLSAQTALNQNQINFLTSRNRLQLGSGNNALANSARQQELIQEEALAKQKQVIAEARQKVQIAREQNNNQLAAEQALSIQKDVELKLLQISEDSQKKLNDLKLKDVQETLKINQIELEIFRRTEQAKLETTRETLKNRFDEEQKVSDKITARQIELIIQQKQQERNTLLAQGNLTNQQELRLATELQNEISKIKESAAQEQATKQIQFALLTSVEKAALKKRQEDISKIQQEIINRGGVENLDEVTRTRIRNLKIQQELVQAQIQATKGTPNGAKEKQAFEDESSKLLTEKAKSSAKVQTEALLAAQTQALTSFTAGLESKLQEEQAKKRAIDIKLNFNPDLSSLDPLAKIIAENIIKKLKEESNKAVSEQASQSLIGGAPQGGS